MLKASIIIAFFNKLDILKLVFAGFERQSEKDFEVIIADDGSNENIVSELKSYIKCLPFKVKHVWHEDKGFRKTKILNEALKVSTSDYLIFIDGDCIPHSEFVREHILNKENSVCLTGRRVCLSEKISSALTIEKVKNGFIENNICNLLFDSLFGKSSHVEKSIYVRNSLIRKIISNEKTWILGCNFSLHKIDLLKINGFDERYEGPWYGEDTDVEFRLLLNGCKLKCIKNSAIIYHVYHPILKSAKQNCELYEEVKKIKQYYTPYGIEKR